MLLMALTYSGLQEVTEIGEVTTVVVGEAPEDVFKTFNFASTYKQLQVLPQSIVPLG